MQKQFSKTELINYVLFVILKRKGLLFFVGVLTFLCIIFATYLITPTWEATAIVLVERSSKQNLSIFKDVNSPVGTTQSEGTDASAILPILTGENMAYQISEEFALDTRLKDKRFNPKKLRDKIKNLMVDVMLSPITFLQAVGILEKGEKNWLDAAAEDFIEEWQSIEVEEGASVVDITIYGETPKLAMDIANRMVEVLKDTTQSFTRGGATSSYGFVGKKVKAAEKRLRKAEEALARFKEENNIIMIEEEKKLKINRLNELESELLATAKQRKEVEARLSETNTELRHQPEKIPVSTIIAQNPVLTELDKMLQSNEIKLAALLTEKKENHPETRKLKEEIARNVEALKSITQTIVQSQVESPNPIYQGLLSRAIDLRTEGFSLKARELSIKKAIKDFNAELKTLPGKELKLAKLQEDVTVNSSTYQAVRTRLEELTIEKESMINEYNIRVLDRAYVSETEDYDWPMWILSILAGIILGIIFGFGSIFFIEYWNDAFITHLDVEKTLSLPYLGSVPDFEK